MQIQSENFKWNLIARSLSGEASLEEHLLLEKLLNEDDELRHEYNALKHFWNTEHYQKSFEEKENSAGLQIIIEKAGTENFGAGVFQQKRKGLRRNRIFPLSAVAIAVVAVIVLFNIPETKNLNPKTINANPHQLVAQKGSRSRAVLPDGSVVWLNAGSVLTYNNFSSATRQVSLKGEAFFDVVKDAQHPFIVHANGVDIKVLGTAFNVKSYTDDNKVEATLIKGIIQVTQHNKANNNPVFLHPNEKLVIDLKEDKKPIKQNQQNITPLPVFTLYHLDSGANTANLIETAWVYNKLEFRGDSFEELAKKLERWYNIKIFFEDEEVKKLSFNGSFEDETVAQAFEALKVAAVFGYTIKKNEVFIKSVE